MSNVVTMNLNCKSALKGVKTMGYVVYTPSKVITNGYHLYVIHTMRVPHQTADDVKIDLLPQATIHLWHNLWHVLALLAVRPGAIVP